MSRFSNILLVQLGDIGDVVLTTPTIRSVREFYPDSHISILVRRPFGSLLLADPNLSKVIEVSKYRGRILLSFREHILFGHRLWRSHFDLVICLRTGDRSAILSYVTGARERIGLSAENKPFWYKHLFTRLIHDPPYAQFPVHPGADQSLRIVRAIGINCTDSKPKLYVAPNDRQHSIDLLAKCGLPPNTRWVTINPCSRWKYKEWGYSKWGEVIDFLWNKHGLATVLIGSVEEENVASNIADGRSEHVFNLSGKTTLGELSAIISMSVLHLGVDSAAPHIAAAVETPTLTIFGPGNWRSWTVADDLHRVVTSELPCVPCNRKGCDDSGVSRCLDELGVDKVYAQAKSILSALDLDHSIGTPANAG